MFVVKCEKGYFKMNTKKFKETSYFVGYSKKPITFFTSKEQARKTVLEYDITNFTVMSTDEIEMRKKLQRTYDTMSNEKLLAMFEYYSLAVTEYAEHCVMSNTIGIYSQSEYSRLKTENELLKIKIELMKRGIDQA